MRLILIWYSYSSLKHRYMFSSTFFQSIFYQNLGVHLQMKSNVKWNVTSLPDSWTTMEPWPMLSKSFKWFFEAQGRGKRNAFRMPDSIVARTDFRSQEALDWLSSLPANWIIIRSEKHGGDWNSLLEKNSVYVWINLTS